MCFQNIIIILEKKHLCNAFKLVMWTIKHIVMKCFASLPIITLHIEYLVS